MGRKAVSTTLAAVFFGLFGNKLLTVAVVVISS